MERSQDNRYVVFIPGPPAWGLPPATPLPCRYGGHRSMHELAVAIAATGRAVEVRGGVDLSVLQPLAEAAGVRLPELPDIGRQPDDRDVVILSEGQHPITFAHAALSPARLIMMLLGPPGLSGWPFVAGWSMPDLLDVDIEAVARPEHFAAIAAMGFELWSQSAAMLDRVTAAGATGALIGCGRPSKFPPPLPKRFDVVTLGSNRWVKLARQVVAGLPGSVVHCELPATSNEQVLEAFGQARLFIHPLRIEGHSRLGREARAMGAVPVVLNSSPFSVGLDEDGGAVAVSTPEEMPDVVMALLRDPGRLDLLRERAMATAREQVDWERYVERIDTALSRPAPPDPARDARAGMGHALAAQEAELARELSTQIRELRGYARSLEFEMETIRGLHDAMTADRDRVVAERQVMQDTRAWRVATRYWIWRDRFVRRNGSAARVR